MSRLLSLLGEIRSNFRDDWYFENFDLSIELPQARKVVAAYDHALNSLNQESWAYLSEKAINKFSAENNDGRGKQQFFNQLNEAFAFRFLLQQGYQQVSFIPEGLKNKRTPDIRFIRNNTFAYCEVKTISISDDEISRMASESVHDSSIYQKLDALFEKKLISTIDNARDQITSAGTDGLVYIIVHFDDFTLAHYSIYRQQLVNTLNSRFRYQEIFIKIGLQGRKHIHHHPFQKQM